MASGAPVPAQAARDPRLRIVAFGGGTGLPMLLEGMRELVGVATTAVVSVADDGGSSGRLRRELGIAPPGDVRNCLVALAGRRRLAEVFDYRFEGDGELGDHSVGNLIIAALADMSGGFCEGVEQAGRFLRIRGQVYPAATESLTLVVSYADGTVTRGESTLREAGKVVTRVTIEPAEARAPAGVLEALSVADAVVLSPGSLFTSTIPALLGAGVVEELGRFAGPVIYVANVMTQPGETVGLTLAGHLRALATHIGPVVTDVFVHAPEVPEPVLARYREEGAELVRIDREDVEELGVDVYEASVLPEAIDAEVRHDPNLLAQAVHDFVRAGAGSSAVPRESGS